MKSKLVILIILGMLLIFPTNVIAHSGRTDSNGGHNCSAASKAKGLCSGYHYHNGNPNSSSTPTKTYGCTDKTAKNYNSKANTDNGTCQYYSYGCTDSNALNFNSSAEKDDGSCQKKVYGCMNKEAENYNSEANVDDNTCIAKETIKVENSETETETEDKKTNSLPAGIITTLAIGGTIFAIKRKR